MKGRVIVGILIIVAVIVFFTFQFRTGKVVTTFPEKFEVGDNFNAGIIITLDSRDVISGDTPVRFTITKEGYVVSEEVLRFRDFIAKSDNPVEAVQRENGLFYEIPGKYFVPLDKVLEYQFVEAGEYELSFTIESEDLRVKKSFNVD